MKLKIQKFIRRNECPEIRDFNLEKFSNDHRIKPYCFESKN